MPDFGNKSTYWTWDAGSTGYNVVSGLREMPANGWIKSVTVRAAGKDQNVNAKLAIWDQDDGDKLLWASGSTVWNPTLQWRTESLATPLAVRGRRDLRLGFWTPYGNARQYSTSVLISHSLQIYQATNDPPNPWSTNNITLGELAIYATYVANEKPEKGVWTGKTPSGTGGGPTPVLEGTLTHSPAEQGLDRTERVEIVYAKTGVAESYSYTFAPTAAERASGRFSRQEISFDLGQEYSLWFRHRDTWGTWSVWSNVRTFTAEIAPQAPTLTSPLGKIHPPSGFSYAGSYNHPTGLSANAVRIEVYNKRGTSKIYESGTIPISVADGGTWSVPEFHGALDLSTHYSVRAALRDTAGAWGAYGKLAAFNTNFVPFAPKIVTPRGGQETGSRVLSASVLDPDGDLITDVQFELVNNGTGAVITGYPKSATISSDGRAATLSAAELTADVVYKWRAQAYDGYDWGPWSLYEQFTYAVIPEITLITPTAGLQRNRVKDPSASGVSSFWTEENRVQGVDYIERVSDGNAAFGEACWEAVESAASANRFVSDLIPVDNTLPVFLAAHIKKLDGVARSHLYLECYNSSATLTGTVYPGDVNGLDVALDWSKAYGDIVWPAGSVNTPALPAATTTVRIVLEPSRASAATVRFDALDFRQLGTIPTKTGWDSYGRAWFGFFDGDTQAALETGDDYLWRGAPGDSLSDGLNIFTDTSGALLMDYYSEASADKVDDRLVIERYMADETWLVTYDTGYSGAGGARTAIPFPAGILKNEGRFRATVHGKDTVGKTGSSAPVEFDVRFIGPPELDILGLLPNTETAEISILYEQSTIPPESYGGTEILRQSPGESPVTLAVITDQEATEYVDPYPVNGAETTYLVRQRENVMGQQVESRTTQMTGTVDYTPYNFLKDVDAPEESFIRFKDYRGALPQDKAGDASGATSLIPWGSRKPIHFVPEVVYSTGSFTVRLYDVEGQATVAEDHRTLAALWKRRPICALLTAFAPERRFVFLTDFGRSFGDYVDDVEISWEEDGYKEDYYLRLADERGA